MWNLIGCKNMNIYNNKHMGCIFNFASTTGGAFSFESNQDNLPWLLILRLKYAL